MILVLNQRSGLYTKRHRKVSYSRSQFNLRRLVYAMSLSIDDNAKSAKLNCIRVRLFYYNIRAFEIGKDLTLMTEKDPLEGV